MSNTYSPYSILSEFRLHGNVIEVVRKIFLEYSKDISDCEIQRRFKKFQIGNRQFPRKVYKC